MEALFANQNQIIGAINQLLSNFKKDGADRKTSTLVKKRLSTLEQYWQEFQSNHIKLCEYDDKSHEYFVSNTYQRVSEFYMDTRAYIMNYLPSESKAEEKFSLRPATPLSIGNNQQQEAGTSQAASINGNVPPQQAQAFMETQSQRDQGSSSKSEEMLRKQRINFKAFARTIAMINLDNISTKWEFEDVLNSVQTRWSIIDNLHWEIENELFEENIEYEQAFNSYEKQYQDIKKSICNRMWSQRHREISTPHMDIPSFSGNYHQWVSFKDLFIESIHNNRALSNAQKMQFLKGKVRGEAEKLIQHLHISTENYQVCWDILNHRFNNTKLICYSHFGILMNLPTLHQQSAAAIKKMHDVTNECLNAIKSLKIDISNWDPMIVYIVSNKLDAETHNDYLESLKKPRDIPSLKDFLDFLESKFTSLETSKRKTDITKNYQQPETSNYNSKRTYQYKAYTSNQVNPVNKTYTANKASRFNIQKCPVCDKEHGIFHCNTFLELQPDMKQKTIAKLSLCKNCLYNHRGKECYSNKKCRLCKEDHNTLLHDAFCKVTPRQALPNAARSYDSNKEPTQFKNNVLQEETGEILLATAKVQIQSADGSYQTLRALIDQGSQTSLISENAAQQLGLPRKRCKGVIFGVGARENNCKGILSVNISSIHNDYSINTDVFIMKHLINNLPNKSFSKPSWHFINHVALADPEFYISRPVDLLLGADVYSEILQSGIIKENEFTPIAQQTRFGWILCGNTNNNKSYHCNVAIINVDDFQKFWTIEDIKDNDDVSAEDERCLQYYQSTTTRDSSGRYIVRLPLHPDVDIKLGLSKQKAVAQFYQLEKKFQKQEIISNEYKAFINEYIKLGHMHRTISNETPSYYLPHHCVQRADSETTALRVVFNASGITTSGFSLNDLMYRGPNLQQDLLSLVLKWRQYQFAFTADIEKMFRQIVMHPDDQKYQQIVWRPSTNQQLQSYQLATVTYGTKAAPFLAMMTLKQLASDEKHRFPAAAKVLEEQFYMDDLLSGNHSIKSAKQLKSDLIALLKSGGFNLRKWSSNESTLIENIDSKESEENTFNFRHQESTKTLGLLWIAKDDEFTFQCKMSAKPLSKVTKRTLLAEISKVFDPLGWIAPILMPLKLLFQKVWAAELQWDDQVSDEIYQEWQQLRSNMDNISQIKIPRWIGSGENESIQLHGFSDASLKAYSCVIYARISKQTETRITILAAKTKIVPMNKSNKAISLPRLELCGAQLLSKLMIKVKQSLSNQNITVFGWCDSTAVLGWLQGEPSRWKPFVANRVQQITEIMPSNCWRYVKSQENPADCASRGLAVNQLKDHTLWWNGPKWLPSFNQEDIINQISYNTELETKKIKQSNVTQIQDTSIIQDLISNVSNFTRAVRVLAWIRRALSNNRIKQTYLTADEISAAKLKIIKHMQECVFLDDLNNLKQHGTVKSKSNISSLNPFLDKNGLLRVGGRLKHSNISEDMKHPFIIPHSNNLTNLLIDHAHKQTFHGGARLTLSWLRQQYWILGGNRAIKKRLRQCVICKRHNPINQHQLMGDLPEARTNPTRPFYHCGVDYTGFVEVKSSRGRGIKATKGYVAVFVCMTTKAVHLELVSDLSSSAFLAALRRLSARRGTPRHIYSDNGTNFVGANKKLVAEFLDIKSIQTNDFFNEISNMNIKWHFNAPSWPSAGGLWESSVKSLKYHLRRVVGDQKLTYEEYSTLLAQLEACLNSRPLCAITEDPNDINYLTPSHFLASGPILTIIETERDERTRWQLTQKIFNDIWKRWRTEYLTQLSVRSKWRESKPNINLDDIVIIHDANVPSGSWALGRVVDLHPGNDGHVRVVTVKTSKGLLKRPIIKLSVLPVNNYQSSSISEQTKQISTSAEIKHKPKSIKTSCFNYITMTLMLLMLFISSPVHGAYNFKTMETNNSIYFEKISSLRLIQGKWKVVVYYDMEPYYQGTKILSTYYNHVEDICNKLEKRTYCDLTLLQLRHGIVELDTYDRMLQSQQFDKRMRSRRGLIDGVGYIANSLFGVLDAHFAEQYQKDISSIRANQKHLSQFWKNQTSIIEAENNLLKRVENSINKQHKMFNHHLNNLGNAVNILKNETEKIELMNEYTSASIIANNILMNLQNIQDTLVDTITNVQYFNVHLLTPEQLRNELSIISGQLSKDLSLPIDNTQTDLHKLYKILRVRARMTAQYFIFELQISLINRNDYDIYHLIAIFHQVENAMISITPISKYVGLDIKKDTYMTIQESELQKCVNIDSTSKLCDLQKPIYQRDSDQNFCIKDHLTNECKTIATTCQDTWTALENINTFILTCCGQCTLRIICEHQVTTEHLSGVSILALGSDCVIKGESFTITSHNQHSNEIYLKPDIIKIDIAPVNYLINLSIPFIPTNQTEFKESFDNIHEQIKQMKAASEHITISDDEISFHDVHHYVAIYIVASIAVACAAYVWVRARRAAAAARARAARARQVTPPLAVEVSDQCISEKAEHSEVHFSKSLPNIRSASVSSVNKASSPIFTKCSFKKIIHD